MNDRRRGYGPKGERGQRRAVDLTRFGQAPLNAVAWTALPDVYTPLGVPLPT